MARDDTAYAVKELEAICEGMPGFPPAPLRSEVGTKYYIAYEGLKKKPRRRTAFNALICSCDWSYTASGMKRHVGKTKRRSKTNWKRVDALKDSDTDFSDAPELGPDFFARAIIWPGPKKADYAARRSRRADLLPQGWPRLPDNDQRSPTQVHGSQKTAPV